VVGDAAGDAFRIRDDQSRPDLRITRVEFGQNPRQQTLGDRRTGPQQQGTAHLAIHFREACIHFVGQPENPFRIGQRQLAGRRQRDAAMPALEQACIVLLLELPHLERDRRLGHEQGIGGPREAEMLRHGIKDL